MKSDNLIGALIALQIGTKLINDMYKEVYGFSDEDIDEHLLEMQEQLDYEDHKIIYDKLGEQK